MSIPAKWSTAYSRFGFGSRCLGAAATGDPRAAIEAELARPGAGRIADDALPTSEQALVTLYGYNKSRDEARARADALRNASVAMPTPVLAAAILPSADAKPEMTPKERNPVAETYAAEAQARLQAGADVEVGYVERLVAFWSNHFCVSAEKGGNVRILAGAFEREAIRPHVLGKFADMLRAAERHPAMLHYLDNSQSVGPDSPAGRNGKRGLNENLAREILELHTLGADAGYAQADVTEFARALTGWTVAGPDGRLGPPGAFVFNIGAHEGGERPLLGHAYEDGGFSQAQAVLDDLARAPATARHIATKLVRHFVADDPPPALVARLSDVFQKTDGDLRAVSRALVDDDLAWSAPPTKLRTPYEMVVAAIRALGLETQSPQPYLRLMTLLGMPLWSPGGPNGFSDVTAAWASPEGIKARLEAAAALAKTAKAGPAPKDLIDRGLPDASADTREAVLHAESRPQAYALALMSPEFQRR